MDTQQRRLNDSKERTADRPCAGSVDATAFAIQKRNDLPRLKHRLKKTGRVHIPNFFVPDAARNLSDCLERDVHWNIVTNNHGRHLDLDAVGISTLADADKIKFRQAVHSQARDEFQYLFGNYPIYDSYHNRTLKLSVLSRLFEFLNQGEFLSLMRGLTGDSKINFADAQATRYEKGDFLTDHDDDVSGKNRRCAFVISLTKEWRADWGGLLQFFDKNGHVSEAFVPKFNALNVFKVPQRHSVSVVSPFAGSARYSITGWLRSGIDPMRQSTAPARTN